MFLGICTSSTFIVNALKPGDNQEYTTWLEIGCLVHDLTPFLLAIGISKSYNSGSSLFVLLFSSTGTAASILSLSSCVGPFSGADDWSCLGSRSLLLEYTLIGRCDFSGICYCICCCSPPELVTSLGIGLEEITVSGKILTYQPSLP